MTDIQKIAEERYPYMQSVAPETIRARFRNLEVQEENKIIGRERSAFISGYQYGREWRSVEEDGLPPITNKFEESDYLLCYDEDRLALFTGWYSHSDKKWRLQYGRFNNEIKCSHWMPLPSPPTNV